MSNAPDMSKLAKVGRIAFRHEGNFWNAYYADPNNMKDAIPLGSIAMQFVDTSEERKQRFIELMRASVSDLIEQALGIRPVWPTEPSPAPESERSGHG